MKLRKVSIVGSITCPTCLEQASRAYWSLDYKQYVCEHCYKLLYPDSVIGKRLGSISEDTTNGRDRSIVS
jgi:hypothetical protein